MFTAMKLCVDERFILSSHTDGFFSVVDVEAGTSQVLANIFGEVDNICGIELLARPSGPNDPQLMLVATSSGMYQCMVTNLGHLMYCMEVYFEGENVTNVCSINDEDFLVSYTTLSDGLTKLVIFNLDTREEKVMIHPDA